MRRILIHIGNRDVLGEGHDSMGIKREDNNKSLVLIMIYSTNQVPPERKR